MALVCKRNESFPCVLTLFYFEIYRPFLEERHMCFLQERAFFCMFGINSKYHKCAAGRLSDVIHLLYKDYRIIYRMIFRIILKIRSYCSIMRCYYSFMQI